MKLLVLSDTHFGYDEGGERWGDAFECATGAVAAHQDADAILLVGDIFDSRVATPETMARALSLFNHIRRLGIPVIGIHGTHERRAKEFVNPIQLLERAGLITYLHCSSLALPGPENVAVFGMGGVPDQYAGSALQEWNPTPLPGQFNILLLHQSLEGFLFAPQLLKQGDVPKGFDLIINGHIHDAQQAMVGGTPLLITGSAIQTQFSADAEKPRGYWTVEVSSGNAQFVFHFFPDQRLFFSVRGTPQEIEKHLQDILCNPPLKKPVIRVHLPNETVDLEQYKEKAIFLFKQERPVVAGVTLEEHRLSVREMGQKLLAEHLQQAGLDPGLFADVFELLEAGKLEEAEKRLLGAAREKI